MVYKETIQRLVNYAAKKHFDHVLSKVMNLNSSNKYPFYFMKLNNDILCTKLTDKSHISQ